MMKIDGQWIKDEHGRTLLLRGANLSGASKVPFTPDGATYRREGFFDHRNVSFVGRPFPLDEADEHYTRLRAWGMTFLRFLITWEAVEHAGPGSYDEAYLDYLYAVVKKAGDYGIDVFIDPHQDVWSRWTGGDGAPGWTLEAAGFDLTKLDATGAAMTHAMHGDPFPRMIWPTNYTKLGAATMFTLFFGGNDFAPKTLVDGVPVQEYLQSHYLNAVRQVALRLKDLPNVVGYDSLNEPGSGFIGMNALTEIPRGLLVAGVSPTPFQAMLAGAGYPQSVGVYPVGIGSGEPDSMTVINPDGLNVWRGGACVWKHNGVWTDDGGDPRLLRPDHFAVVDGHAVDFNRDYLKPFMRRFIREIRAVHPGAFLFLEGVPGSGHPDWSPDDAPNAVNAGHWYDAMTLVTKSFNPDFAVDPQTKEIVYGEDAVRQAFVAQVGRVKHESLTRMGGVPTLIGEFGLPFDLEDKIGYRKGDFRQHTRALAMYYDVMDAHLLHCTLWNYTPDNSNARGDLWNDEDLSIFSRDQQDKDWREDLHAGGRALPAIVRPYARRTAGEPLAMHYDPFTRVFTFRYRPDSSVRAPTEIFLPSYPYANGFQVELSAGTWEYDAGAQTLAIRAAHADGVTLTVRPA